MKKITSVILLSSLLISNNALAFSSQNKDLGDNAARNIFSQKTYIQKNYTSQSLELQKIDTEMSKLIEGLKKKDSTEAISVITVAISRFDENIEKLKLTGNSKEIDGKIEVLNYSILHLNLYKKYFETLEANKLKAKEEKEAIKNPDKKDEVIEPKVPAITKIVEKLDTNISAEDKAIVEKEILNLQSKLKTTVTEEVVDSAKKMAFEQIGDMKIAMNLDQELYGKMGAELNLTNFNLKQNGTDMKMTSNMSGAINYKVEGEELMADFTSAFDYILANGDSFIKFDSLKINNKGKTNKDLESFIAETEKNLELGKYIKLNSEYDYSYYTVKETLKNTNPEEVSNEINKYLEKPLFAVYAKKGDDYLLAPTQEVCNYYMDNQAKYAYDYDKKDCSSKIVYNEFVNEFTSLGDFKLKFNGDKTRTFTFESKTKRSEYLKKAKLEINYNDEKILVTKGGVITKDIQFAMQNDTGLVAALIVDSEDAKGRIDLRDNKLVGEIKGEGATIKVDYSYIDNNLSGILDLQTDTGDYVKFKTVGTILSNKYFDVKNNVDVKAEGNTMQANLDLMLDIRDNKSNYKLYYDIILDNKKVLDLLVSGNGTIKMDENIKIEAPKDYVDGEKIDLSYETAESRDSNRITNAVSIKSFIEEFYVENGEYPTKEQLIKTITEYGYKINDFKDNKQSEKSDLGCIFGSQYGLKGDKQYYQLNICLENDKNSLSKNDGGLYNNLYEIGNDVKVKDIKTEYLFN